MIVAVESLLPSFLLIAFGFLLAKTPILPSSQWEGVERLNYYVLYPMLLFVSVVRADLRSTPLGPMTLSVTLGVLTIAAGFVATKGIFGRIADLDGPALTSHLQGAIRFNTAVALAVAGALFGQEGLALTAICALAIVPLVNVICVIALAVLASGERPSAARLAKEVASNPLILATVTAAAINLSGLPIYRPVLETCDLLGKGALGLALLLVGAGLKASALAPRLDILLNAAVKLALSPALMGGLAHLMGVNGAALAVVVLTAAVPTASSAYVLARRMGGDGELMATIITTQTILAFATLPVAVWLAGGAVAPP